LAGYLTTHVLDTSWGPLAAGLLIELARTDGDRRTKLNTKTTNEDGRADAPILPEDAFETGSYKLLFHVGAYLDMIGQVVETSRFLDLVPIRFGMSEQTHYHVPLLLSPFGFSTYRRS